MEKSSQLQELVVDTDYLSKVIGKYLGSCKVLEVCTRFCFSLKGRLHS
jgi:hypothetical protein